MPKTVSYTDHHHNSNDSCTDVEAASRRLERHNEKIDQISLRLSKKSNKEGCDSISAKLRDTIQKEVGILESLISVLREQIAAGQLAMTERIMQQEQKLIEQTTTMIESREIKILAILESREIKILRLFEKIEQRIEKTDDKHIEDFEKMHTKMDSFAKNQWKLMGGLVVIGIIFNFYGPVIFNKAISGSGPTQSQQNTRHTGQANTGQATTIKEIKEIKDLIKKLYGS